MVRLHHALHYLAVDRKRHIYRRPLDHGRPVLVAYGMTQLDGDMYDRLRRHRGQRGHVYGHDVVEPYAHDEHRAVPCILEEYVAVVDAAVAFERYCVFVAAVARRGEAALLRRPLVELDILLVRCGGALAPLGRSDVSYDSSEYFHFPWF